MILVDTSIWIDHLRKAEDHLRKLLDNGQVICHPFVIGEVALGNLKHRDEIVRALCDLPQATVAQDEEVLHFITQRSLFARGIGYIDAHLLASAHLTPGVLLWTRDQRLALAAHHLSVAFDSRA